MDAREPDRPGPACPVCSGPIYPGDHVIFGHGDLTHLRCHLWVQDLGDLVERHLRGNAGRVLCHTCLAAGLDITFAEARKATARLRVSAEMTSGPGRCSTCGARSIVTSASPPAS